MAEKARLKESDEILSSIEKSKKSAPLPTPGPKAARKEELINSRLDAPAEQQAPVEDAHPLDFGKYQLPNRAGARAPASAAQQAKAAEALAPPPSTRATPTAEASAAPEAGKKPRRRGTPKKESEAGAAQTESRSGGEKPPAKRRRTSARQEPVSEQAKAQAAQARAGALSQAAPAEPGIQEYEFQDFDAPPRQQTPAAPAPAAKRRSRSAKPALETAGNKAVEAYEFPRVERDAPPSQAPAESLVPEREVHRENFLKRLSSQFEQEFTQRFEDKPAEKKAEDAPSWFDAPEEVRAAEPPLMLHEEEEVDEEAEQFLQSFEEQVKAEEEVRAESFKETLAEKFMRERERYLKELSIDEEQPPEPADALWGEPAPPRQEPTGAHPPVHRRLDLQIQPEMHRQEERAPMPPMTYGPGGTARIQQDSPEELPYIPGAVSKPVAAAKAAPDPRSPADAPLAGKTSEELLLELAAQKSLRRFEFPGPQDREPQGPLKLHFTIPEEPEALDEKPERKRFQLRLPKLNRVVAVSTVAALLVIALIAWPVTTWLRLEQAAAAGGSDEMTALTLPEDTLTVYEDKEYATLKIVPDVVVKKSGITLSNMQVENRLVIQDITSPGGVLLKNLSVGGVIYVQGCALDMLQLENVQAARIIINNPDSRVTVQATGNTNVTTIEIKTPATIQQMNIPGDAGGIQNLLLKKSPDNGALDVMLGGLELAGLTTIGDSLVALADGSSVEMMAGTGDLSLTGQGSVTNLSAGPEEVGTPMVLQLKGVSVTKMNLKGAADLSIAGPVDMMVTASPLSLGGGGLVGTLVVNSGMEAHRIPIDLSGVTVQTLIAETQTRVNATGAAKLNALTANDSVYILGNKVNHLSVNAAAVIYENEPDKITVKPGVPPPQTVADNPNLDYNLPTAQNTLATDTTGDDLATTCNHPRENGGFVIGDGSKDNPFQVSTPAQLTHIGAHLSSHAVQTGDIDIADDSKFSSGFEMIASAGSPFTGVYDGGGYSISSLRISGAGENIGLFAENTGVIRNVQIASGDIKAAAAGAAYVGGVVGFNYQGGLVQACSNGAKVTGRSGGYAGGLVGYNFGGRVLDCYNYAKVSGQTSVGGVVGVNRGGASIAGCYNAGTIEAQSSHGAVAGINADSTIANCYYLTDTAPGGIGTGTGNVSEKSSEELSSAQMAPYLAAGDVDTPWAMPSSGTYTYPILGSAPQGAGAVPTSGSSQDARGTSAAYDDDDGIPMYDEPIEESSIG